MSKVDLGIDAGLPRRVQEVRDERRMVREGRGNLGGEGGGEGREREKKREVRQGCDGGLHVYLSTGPLAPFLVS